MICQIITLVLKSCRAAMVTRTAARTMREKSPAEKLG